VLLAYLLSMQFYQHCCHNKPTLLRNCQTENSKHNITAAVILF